MMSRVIVHSDINHAYAQIEEMMSPKLRFIPMAVGGSEEKRHGIILAKNDLAKKYGVRTGESLREALAKCPDLKIVHPNYDAYVYYTDCIKSVYRQYTDQVESFGLDEAWMDLTHSQRLFGDGIRLAEKIQDEVYARYGLSVSMGVSYNKVFAKLGSDIFKHKGFACITEDNYQDIVWPRPAADLVMVGRHTEYKLDRMGIYTIGDLAKTPAYILKRRFGKMGILLWRFANGYDDDPVSQWGASQPVKSIGNSKTVVHDIISWDQLYDVLHILAQSTAARMRAEHKRGYVISIWLRSSDLTGCQKQKRLLQPTDLARSILKESFALAQSILKPPFALRSVGINVSDLYEYSGFDQPSLFENPLDGYKQQNLEITMQKIHEKYGYQSIQPASMLLDRELTDFDPLSTLHQIHPVSYLNGPIG